MHRYLVYRKGSNSVNQPRTFDAVAIAIVEAKSRLEAERTSWHGEKPNIHGCPTLAAKVLASCGDLRVFPNQAVWAIPASKAPNRDWNAVLETDALTK